MARIFNTPETERSAKALLHDIMLAAGLIKVDQRGGNRSPAGFASNFVSAAQNICKELVNRNFDDIDSSIITISSFRINTALAGYIPSYRTFKPDAVAKGIVYLAELLQVYWDDTIRTPYEIDEFKKTLLGKAVYKYGRYISAVSGKKTSRNTTSPKTAGQPPKNNYKQSGPQSGSVRDLQGNPGEKVYAGSQFIYKIIGDNPQSKNTPNVFIKPLSSAGANGSTNKIFISSGNGYTDCTCYFDDPNEATDFLNKIISNNRVPANITNLRVVKNKADSNGYFLVGTEFGICAISAKTLNEALVECNNNKQSTESSGWEKATESYSKEELEELHTWMRRD